MGTLSAIFRYPIKSHGRESLGEVSLLAGKTMPMDRVWAVTHEATKFDMDAPAWVACANFSIGAKSPTLNAINANWDAGQGIMTLTHPDYPPLVFCPDDTDDHARFIDWVSPMVPANRAKPRGLVRLSERGITDTDYPSISLNSCATNAAVAKAAGLADLSMERWRGNLWFDGYDAWEETHWVGRDIQIGTVILEIREPIARCNATRADPKTGQIDVDTLAVLKDNWGHTNFGVYAVVKQGGVLRRGDTLRVL